MREKLTIYANTDDRRSIIAAQSKLGTLAKGKWKIIATPIGDKRSLNANNYWHGVIVEMFRDYNAEQGEFYSHKQCHDILKRELLPVAIKKSLITGKTIHVLSDSHNLSKEDFGALIERAVAYLAQMGIVVPDPYQYAGIPMRRSA